MTTKIKIFPVLLIMLFFTSCNVFAANRPSAMNQLSALGPDLLNQVTATARGLNTKQTAVDVEVKYIKQETKKISIGSTIGLEPTVRKDNAVIAAFAEWEQACKNLAKQPYEKTEVIRDTHIVTKETYSCKLTCTGNYTLDDTGKTCIEKSNNGQTTGTECPHGTEKDTTTNKCKYIKQETNLDLNRCFIGRFREIIAENILSESDKELLSQDFEAWKTACQSLKECSNAEEMYTRPDGGDSFKGAFYACSPKKCLEGYERTDNFECVKKAASTTPGNTTTTGTNEASKFNTDFQTATDAFNARVKEILTTCANENGYISEDGTKCEQRQN